VSGERPPLLHRGSSAASRSGKTHPIGSGGHELSLANLRHELRTPINAILGYSEILLEDAEMLPKESKYLVTLRSIHDAGTWLLEQVNEWLSPAKLGESLEKMPLVAPRIRGELHEPIDDVMLHTELLLDEFESTGFVESYRADLRRIHDAALQFAALLEDLLGDESLAAEPRPEPSSPAGEPAAATTVEPAPSSVVEAGGNVLVVDDNEVNRDVLSRRLHRQGHRVAMAAGGREALELLRAQPFDIVLLDLMMPEMNGYEVLERMKADDTLRHIPVIMISAMEALDSVVRCIQMGADDYLSKPFNPVLLQARVGSSLGKKRLRDRERSYLEQLRVAQAESEALLLNVLPKPIADRLKRGETSIGDSFPEVTVLFADLVGFTEHAARLPAAQVVQELNKIFSAFDHLVEKHGVEKIKTIGDGYMAVGGLPVWRPDHAEALAAMALDMREEVVRFNGRHTESLSLRIGLHTGPVVAGIIGTKKFSYDLWGDTVNTASRMESRGIINGIQVSAVTAERLKERYVLEPRGMIEVKGKGLMETYVLIGRRS
jgi:adenylate cyclase